MARGKSLESLFGGVFPSDMGLNSSNSTAHGDEEGILSPTRLLEAFIPGYSHIHKFVLYSFGFDVTVVVSLGAVLWLTYRVFHSLWSICWGVVKDNYMAEVTVNSTDEIHTHLIQFLAGQHKITSSRRLMADTPTKSAWETDTEEGSEVPDTLVDAEGNIKWLNFSNQDAKLKPRFTPAIGSHSFWHSGTYFRLSRKELTMLEELGSGSAFKDREVLTLSCFGRSTEPIKGLIEHAKAHYHLGHNAKTVIKRPAPKDMRRYSGRNAWVKIAERPCRPISTVVLDEKRKLDVLKDINEYLSPSTARWYANRGIPYRRGYLFKGPPGTGKTSLTAAIASIFGLDIHVISLLEPTLTEEELGMLFMQLPARSIVLLEDIDTAGLVRQEKREDDTDFASKDGGPDLSLKDLTRALKRANEQTDEDRKKGISLSGLLNVIDGVSSQEGRVLIMTTNHPEKLDEALIRPGRVDHEVTFENATRKQIREIFERMFSSDVPRSRIITTGSTSGVAINLSSANHPSPPSPPPLPHPNFSSTSDENPVPTAAGSEKEVSKDELLTIAQQFSERIPEGVFSPAEIQGFLLTRKKQPRVALAEVEAWVRDTIKEKETKARLARV